MSSSEDRAAATTVEPHFAMPSRSGNVQVDRIGRHFGGFGGTLAGLPPKLRFVFLCCTRRSGSAHLAQLIGMGGRYNAPRASLNHDYVIGRSSRRGLPSFADYLADLARCDARRSRLFIKVTPLHLDLLQQSGLLSQVVGRSDFVMIERADKLGQAIASVIARQGASHAAQVQGCESGPNLVYDRGAIAAMLLTVTEWYRQFDLFFGMNGLVPVSVTYERLVADPVATLGVMAARLGLPEFVIRPEKLPAVRQASTLGTQWRQRYLCGDGLQAAAIAAAERPRSWRPSVRQIAPAA